MVFSSSTFLFLFLPLFLIIYFVVPMKLKNIVLCIFSLFFYAWGEPVYIGLMVFSSVVDFCNGLCMERFPNRKKVFLIISVVINLSLLGFFKYAPLFVRTANQLFGLSVKFPKLALPIGISFYTFQTMSYSIDVYRGEVKSEHHFLDFMAYVSMFPQLIAGPIVRYSTVHEELGKRTISFDSFSDGMIRFLRGLFKKCLIANPIGALFAQVMQGNIAGESAATLWIAMIAFSFQIYFDFSGYTDMAVGIGKMIGFTFPENFHYPYCADTVSDFWRRWHMSLTTWFKDYVYIPLGGSRKGKARTILNILIVWTLTGFWHGAEWNFMLWGLYYGILLVIEKFLLPNVLNKIPAVVRHLYVCIFVLFGWMIFSVEDIGKMGIYLRGMFRVSNVVDDKALFLLGEYWWLFAVAAFFSTPVVCKVHDIMAQYREKAFAKSTQGKVLCAVGTGVKSIVFVTLIVLSIAMMISESYNPFLYFRF